MGLNGDRVMWREMPMDSLGSDAGVVIGPEMHMFGRQQSEGYRAPRQLLFEKVASNDAADRPATDEEVLAIIEELKKSRRPGREGMRKMAALVRTSHPDALDYVNSLTRAAAFSTVARSASASSV